MRPFGRILGEMRPVGPVPLWLRLHRCQRGQAIYVVILYFFLMAGLLFLVLNGGEKINHKVQMQNAADAAAATGAAWYARGLNTVSMCNVGQAQLMSMVIMLDTLETVTPVAVEVADDLAARGQDVPLDSRLSHWLVVGNAESERRILYRLRDIVQAVNWAEYLTYDTGVLWDCVKLLDGFSHAMVEATPLTAQREAIEIARINGAEFGFLTPLWPALPVVDGTFDDFYEPMRNGRMPTPDTPVIGGFAHVMNYRGYHNQVLGPWSYWREPIVDARPMGLFDLSRFGVMFRIVSEMKLNMMFGSSDDRCTFRNWEMDYDKAKSIPDDQLRRAWWESVSFDARYENNEEQEPFPLPQGTTWGAKHHENKPTPSTRSYRTMSRPDLSQYKRANEAREGADPRRAVWYRCQRQRTAHYPELGIFAPHPPNYPDGSPWPYTDAEMQTYWRVTLLRFDGAEKEPADDTLHRNYLPPSGAAMHAPIMFDQAAGDHTMETVSERFTFNGFAYRPGRVRQWTARFSNPNPVDELVAYAQARVYNRWSWDLFTQHWKAKLMRADRWQDILRHLDPSVIPQQGAEVAALLTDDRLKPVRQNLEAYRDDFVKEVTH